MQFTQISLGELYRQRIDWLAVSFQPRTSRTARVCVCRENHIANTERFAVKRPWPWLDRSPFSSNETYTHTHTHTHIYFFKLLLSDTKLRYFVPRERFRFIFIRWENGREMSCVKVGFSISENFFAIFRQRRKKKSWTKCYFFEPVYNVAKPRIFVQFHISTRITKGT